MTIQGAALTSVIELRRVKTSDNFIGNESEGAILATFLRLLTFVRKNSPRIGGKTKLGGA